MAIIASDSGGRDFEPMPEGPAAAVCDMMVDLGLQETNFGVKHQVYIRFQVPEHRVEIDGESKPAIIGQTFTLSMSEKSNLRPLLEGWRGKKFSAEEVRGFDITKVAGQPAYINIVHNESGGKTYANIASLMPIPRGMEKPQLEGEVIVYDGDNLSNFDKLRPWLQEKIKAQVVTREPQGSSPQPQGNVQGFDTDLDDDVPFASSDYGYERRMS